MTTSTLPQHRDFPSLDELVRVVYAPRLNMLTRKTDTLLGYWNDDYLGAPYFDAGECRYWNGRTYRRPTLRQTQIAIFKCIGANYLYPQQQWFQDLVVDHDVVAVDHRRLSSAFFEADPGDEPSAGDRAMGDYMEAVIRRGMKPGHPYGTFPYLLGRSGVGMSWFLETLGGDLHQNCWAHNFGLRKSHNIHQDLRMTEANIMELSYPWGSATPAKQRKNVDYCLAETLHLSRGYAYQPNPIPRTGVFIGTQGTRLDGRPTPVNHPAAVAIPITVKTIDVARVQEQRAGIFKSAATAVLGLPG